MNYLDDYLIHESLTESLKRQNTKEIAEVIDRVLPKYDSIIPRVLIYPVIDELPSDLVDALAVQLHCDFYDFTLSLARRREIVKQSIAWHRIKGTRGAVELAVTAVFGNVNVGEWYEYGGNPYTFRIAMEGAGAFDEQHGIDLLMNVINASKNVRSWLEGVDGDAGITIHYEVSLSDEDAIRYGFASLIDGMGSIGIARPKDANLRYIIEAITTAAGHRTVNAGPSELTAMLIQNPIFAHILAGTGTIPYNPEDIPEWIRRITLPARLAERVGFGYGLAGRRNIPLALPEDAVITPVPTILSGLAGFRQCGLGPPEDALAGFLLGDVLARTGQGFIETDPEDIAAFIPDIYEDARIATTYGSGSYARGKRLLSVARPETAKVLWQAAIAHRGTGGMTIGASMEDLPDTIKELRKSIIAPFWGSAVDSRGSSRIGTALPEKAGLTPCIGIRTAEAGKYTVPLAVPPPFELGLPLAGIGAIGGRLSIGADVGDIPEGQGDILTDAVLAPHISFFSAARGVNRIGTGQRIEDAAASMSVGFSDGKSGIRGISIDPEDIPRDQRDILEDAALTPYMTMKAIRSGVTTVHGTRPEDSGLALKIGIARTAGGRKHIGADPEDLPDWSKGFLKSSALVPLIGTANLAVGSRRIAPAFPPKDRQALFAGFATGAGGRAKISLDSPKETDGRIFMGSAQAITGYITIGADRGDLPPKKRIMPHVGIMQAGISAVG